MKKMENLNRPDFLSEIHKSQLKLTLLNTKKSAIFSIFLILTPFLFLLGVLFKHYLGINLGIFTAFYEWLIEIDPDDDASFLRLDHTLFIAWWAFNRCNCKLALNPSLSVR